MNQDFLTLEEAADLLHKSAQTIRRLIKGGALKAQRIRTPQGFHYLLNREDLEPLMKIKKTFSNLPIQNIEKPYLEEEIRDLTSQKLNLTSQLQIQPVNKPIKPSIDKKIPASVFYFPPLPPAPSVEMKDLLKLLERQHREKMALIQVLSQLQVLLDEKESVKKKSFFEKLFFWRNSL